MNRCKRCGLPRYPDIEKDFAHINCDEDFETWKDTFTETTERPKEESAWVRLYGKEAMDHRARERTKPLTAQDRRAIIDHLKWAINYCRDAIDARELIPQLTAIVKDLEKAK